MSRSPVVVVLDHAVDGVPKRILVAVLLDIADSQKYPGQRMLVVLAKAYVYAAPYVATPEGIFLETVFS